MKDLKSIKIQHYSLDLPTGTISIGPGTVPTSTASVSETSMKDLISAFRKASRLGVFDSAEKVE